MHFVQGRDYTRIKMNQIEIEHDTPRQTVPHRTRKSKRAIQETTMNQQLLQLRMQAQVRQAALGTRLQTNTKLMQIKRKTTDC